MTPNNKDRAGWVRIALAAYSDARGGVEDEADARDLICDILHFMREERKDLFREMRCSVSNFLEELADEDQPSDENIDFLYNEMINANLPVAADDAAELQEEAEAEGWDDPR